MMNNNNIYNTDSFYNALRKQQEDEAREEEQEQEEQQEREIKQIEKEHKKYMTIQNKKAKKAIEKDDLIELFKKVDNEDIITFIHNDLINKKVLYVNNIDDFFNTSIKGSLITFNYKDSNLTALIIKKTKKKMIIEFLNNHNISLIMI